MSIVNHPSLSSPSTSSFPPHPQSFHRRLISHPFSRLTPAKSQTLRLISICCQGQNTGPIKGPDGIGSEISSSASFPCSSPSSAINFLTLCHNLKTTKRKGWINHGIKGPESIADHMYRMSLMALIAGDVPGLNRERCIKIAIVHDIAEAIVGDITPSDGIPKAEKSRREQAALNEMCEVLGGGMRAEEIKELWAEYENNASLEANLVKDFDKNMGRFLTSFSYQQQGSFKLKLERVGQQRSYQEEAQPWLKDPINHQNFYIISSNLLIQTRKVVRCI